MSWLGFDTKRNTYNTSIAFLRQTINIAMGNFIWTPLFDMSYLLEPTKNVHHLT